MNTSDKLSTFRIPPLALLSLLSLVIIAHRVLWSSAPLLRDVSTYAVIGHELLQGKTLYTDVWDHKPPAIYLTYTIGEFAFGYSQTSILILGCLASLFALFGVYRIARSLAGENAALFAAAAWALLAGDILLEAHQPNTETFITPFLLWSIALTLELPQSGRKTLLGMIAGVLLAAATLYKYIALLPYLGFFLGWIYTNEDARKQSIPNVFALFLGFLIPWTLVVTWLGASGALTEFYNAVFTYNKFYSGNIAGTVLNPLAVWSLLPRCAYPLLPLAAFMLVAVIQTPGKVRSSKFIPLFGWIVGAYVTIYLPGKFYNHYYQFLVPVFCAGSVLGTGNLSRALRVIVLLFLIGYESWFLKFTPEAWSKLKHGNVYLASRDLGEHLKDTAAAAAVFQWGSDTGMYFYSQKSPPTSAFYVQPLLEGPLAPKLTEKTLRELERVSPELVVIDPKVTGITPPEYPIRNWIETNYSLKESFAGYHILQRNK